jgi:hypothetical protein
MSNFFDCRGIEEQLNRTKKKLDHGSAESLETLSYKKLLLLLLLCQLCLKLGFFCFFL